VTFVRLLKQTVCPTLQPADSRICAGPRMKIIVSSYYNKQCNKKKIGRKGPPNYHTKQIAMCLFCHYKLLNKLKSNEYKSSSLSAGSVSLLSSHFIEVWMGHCFSCRKPFLMIKTKKLIQEINSLWRNQMLIVRINKF